MLTWCMPHVNYIFVSLYKFVCTSKWHHHACACGSFLLSKLGNTVAHKSLHCCTMVHFFLLSPHPADPTLTTENLMEMLKGVEDRWEELGYKLCFPYGVRGSEMQKIRLLYHSDHQRMEALINHYMRHYPLRSWKRVASALEEMQLPQLAEVVTTKYVRGMWQGLPLASGG